MADLKIAAIDSAAAGSSIVSDTPLSSQLRAMRSSIGSVTGSAYATHNGHTTCCAWEVMAHIGHSTQQASLRYQHAAESRAPELAGRLAALWVEPTAGKVRKIR